MGMKLSLWGGKERIPKEAAQSQSAERAGFSIASAEHPWIRESKLSMRSKPNKVEAVVPDFSHPETLSALGFINENGTWYAPQRDYFPEPLSSDSVILIYNREKGDVGFCSRDEFSSIYASTEAYDKGDITYLDPGSMAVGVPVNATKCATGEFTLFPEGTRVKTNEGEVDVRPGEAVIVNEKLNSLYLMPIAKVLERYIADPFSPASSKAFELLKVYTDTSGTEEKKSLSYAKLLSEFLYIDRNVSVQLSLDNSHGERRDTVRPETLREEFIKSRELCKQLFTEYAPQLTAPSFNERLARARELFTTLAGSTYSAQERQVREVAIMTALLPKTNGHQHLKGSVPKETLLELATKHGVDEAGKQKLLAAYESGSNGFQNLDAFNEAYGVIAYPVSQPADYRIAVRALIERANVAGQLTCEIRCSVIGQKDDEGNPLPPEQAAENIITAIQETRASLGKEAPAVGFTLLGYRGKHEGWDKPEEVYEHARLATELAKKYPDMRFSFDIAGPEDTGYGPLKFASSFDLIRAHNKQVTSQKVPGESVGMTIHAGETPTYGAADGTPRAGYQAIREAISLGVMRIGHGVQAVHDEETMDLLKKHNVTVEICGCCNVNTIPINTEGMAKHPIQEFMKRGIKVTLCTDNDTICDTGISGEYGLFLLSGHGQLMNWNALKRIVADSIQSSFITEAEKLAAEAESLRRVREIERMYNEVVELSKHVAA